MNSWSSWSRDIFLTLRDVVRPRWKHRDRNVRKAAVAQLTRQDILYMLAKDPGEEWDVQEAAIARLTDQALLSDLAVHGWLNVREKAAARITDRALLETIAATDPHCSVRVVAYRTLGDEQAALKESAAEDSAEARRRGMARSASCLRKEEQAKQAEAREKVIWCTTCKRVLATGDYITSSGRPPSAKEMELDVSVDEYTCKACRSTAGSVYKDVRQDRA